MQTAIDNIDKAIKTEMSIHISVYFTHSPTRHDPTKYLYS